MKLVAVARLACEDKCLAKRYIAADCGEVGGVVLPMNMMREPDRIASPSHKVRLAGASTFPFSVSILPGAIRALDLCAITLAALMAAGIEADADRLTYQTVCAIFVCFSHMMLGERASLFGVAAIMRPLKRADDIVLAIVTSFLLFMSVAFALDASKHFTTSWIMTFATLAAFLTLTARVLAYTALDMLSRREVIGHNLAVLGVGEQARRFLRHFDRSKPYFTSLAGVFYVDEAPGSDLLDGRPVIGDIEALFERVRAGSIDAVVVAMPWNADRHVVAAVERLKELPIDVYLSTDLIGFELNFRPVLGAFNELPVFEVVQRPLSGWSWALKTLMDYAIASALLLLLSPLLLVVAIAIKLDSPGPILFRQARLGFNNREFHIFKFRSMYHGPQPEAAVRQASRGDPRVTRVGRFIRATSIDELPQILNVLNGTMSLVGPRPHAVSHNEEYGRQIRGYFARHKVKPGITGWAQVNGLRGETEKLGKMEARIQHDIYYAENWSLLFDIRIMVMTAFVVLFQESAY